MVIKRLSKYTRDVKKLTKAHKLTTEQIEATEQLFAQDPHHSSLRLHKIVCKKDKDRYSITVPSTQYRILITKLNDSTSLNTLVDRSLHP